MNAPETNNTSFIRNGFLIIARFIKKELVLVISALCMFISMFFVPPSAAYWDYIDFRVLVLLFCLMAVVAGLQCHGVFTWLADCILRGKMQRRILFLLLFLLSFFSSMLVTNDVALITFVPFAILILELTGQETYLIFVVVMQTVAANLGSMATPVGNPQNLYLYSSFHLTAMEFFSTVLPYVLLALPLLTVSVVFCPKERLDVNLPERQSSYSIWRIVVYLILFVLCLLSVFHILHFVLLFAFICIALLIMDRPIFKKIDYSLLLTFVCFFVFAGNIGAIGSIHIFLQKLMSNHPLLTAIFTSQVISNVPTAVLLSGFTTDWKALLLGVDIGGLGTPIASLASLISFRLYMKSKHAHAGRYMRTFILINILGLVVFFCAAILFRSFSVAS